MADETVWRRRFLLFMAARLFGLATFLLGLAVVYTDLLRSGGWPAVGAVLIIMGALDAVLAPKLMKKAWDAEDRGRSE